MTDLYMAFDLDTRTPIGLLNMENGVQEMRGLGQWNEVSADNHHFDDVEVVNVKDDFIQLFDMLDQRDKLPTYQQTQKFAIRG